MQQRKQTSTVVALLLMLLGMFWILGGCVAPDGTVVLPEVHPPEATALAASEVTSPTEDIPVARLPKLPKVHTEWTNYTPGEYTNALLVQEDAIWLATSGGAVRWTMYTDEYVRYTPEYGLAGTNVNALAQGSDGSVWFGTDSGASRLDVNGEWTTYTSSDGLAGSKVSLVAAGKDGSIWFATENGVSRRRPDGEFTTYTDAKGLSLKSTNFIAPAPDGSMWFAVWLPDAGVARLDQDGAWKTFTTANGLSNNHVSAMTAASDGSMWVATSDWLIGDSGGINRYGPDGTWQTYQLDKPTAEDLLYVQSMAAGTDGSMWVYAIGLSSHTFTIVRLTPDGQQTALPSADGAPTNADGLPMFVMAMTAGPDGSIWFSAIGAEQGEAVSMLDQLKPDGSRATYKRTLNRFYAGDTIAFGPNGALWIGNSSDTAAGVGRLNVDGTTEIITQKDGLGDARINDIAVAPDGSMWFASDGGLSQLTTEGQWITYTVESSLVDNIVYDIVVAPDRSLWFATHGGIHKLDIKGEWTTYTVTNMTEYGLVFAVAAGPDGSMWFGTEQGAIQLTPEGEWITHTVGSATEKYTYMGFAQVNGVEWEIDEIVAGYDGSMWFAPSSTFISGYPPLVRLTTDGQWISYTAADGIAGDTVYAMAALPDGSMWFGTNKGVSRLGADGRWTTLTTADGLADNYVTDIAVGEDGSMWFMTRSGLSHYQPGEEK